MFSILERSGEIGVGLLIFLDAPVQGWLGPVSYVVLGLVVVGLVWLAVRKARERSRATAGAGFR